MKDLWSSNFGHLKFWRKRSDLIDMDKMVGGISADVLHVSLWELHSWSQMETEQGIKQMRYKTIASLWRS